MKLEKIFFYLLVIILLTACKSSESGESPNNLTLLSASWVLDKLEVNGSEYSDDISNYKLILNSDMTYSLTDVDNSVTNGTWTLSNDDTVLNLDSNQFLIISLSQSAATISGTSRSDKVGTNELIYYLVKIQ